MANIKKSSLRKLIRSIINEAMEKEPFKFGQFSTEFKDNKFPQITSDHSFLDMFKKDNYGQQKYPTTFLSGGDCKNLHTKKGKMSSVDYLKYIKYCSELSFDRPSVPGVGVPSKISKGSDIGFDTGVEHDCPGCPQQQQQQQQ